MESAMGLAMLRPTKEWSPCEPVRRRASPPNWVSSTVARYRPQFKPGMSGQKRRARPGLGDIAFRLIHDALNGIPSNGAHRLGGRGRMTETFRILILLLAVISVVGL